MKSGLLPFDLIFQDADLLDFELYDVTVLEKTTKFETAAVADRSRTDELAGHESFVFRHVGDDFLEGKQHAFTDAAGTGFAVHPRLHPQLVGVPGLVRGDYPRAQDVATVEALAFSRPEPALHLDSLGVAGREVVEDGEAEDVILGLADGNIGTPCPW
jgi:hypothetical protein